MEENGRKMRRLKKWKNKNDGDLKNETITEQPALIVFVMPMCIQETKLNVCMITNNFKMHTTGVPTLKKVTEHIL